VISSEAIIVAVITGGFAVVVAVLQNFRKENRDDHAFVVTSLNRIENKIDDHVRDHANGDL
jgi:Na+/melibiose symporter-like transporter